jgi:hypothetical protein
MKNHPDSCIDPPPRDVQWFAATRLTLSSALQMSQRRDTETGLVFDGRFGLTYVNICHTVYSTLDGGLLMPIITVMLPEQVYAAASAEAKRAGVDVAMYCGAKLSDLLLNSPHPLGGARSTNTKQPSSPRANPNASTAFDVARAFPEANPGSARLAQRFMDEAMQLPGVTARRHTRGMVIDIRPNFVRVEHLKTRRVGITVSFYGRNHSNSLLRPGMGAYKRAYLETDAQLQQVLPLVKAAYNLKVGTA